MLLDTELKVYDSKKEELLKHYEGKYTLIVGEEFFGAFDHLEDAYKMGVQKFGNVPMLIKKITKEDPIVTIPALTTGLMNVHL
jgi:hypothetical protein